MDNKRFYEHLRKTLFKGELNQNQVDGINGIIMGMDEVGDGDIDTLSYALATAYHETGSRMIPVREGFAKSDSSARQMVSDLARKRGPKSAVAKYAKPTGPYNQVYYGRGHVQLTWLENYEKASKVAGVDLVKDPDKILDPVISARVLISGLISGQWGGNKGIADYEGSDDHLDTTEATEARRTVNGKDKAALIAGYHKAFYDALTEAEWQPKTNSKPIPISATIGTAAVVGGLTFWPNIQHFFHWLTSFLPF